MISLMWLAVVASTPDTVPGDPLRLVPVTVEAERITLGTTDAPEIAAPIRLWISNSRQFREGERARVQVETSDDGYLLVFNYDTDGRLRVLYPVDPGDDNLVRGGRRYEIRGRGDRESFTVGRDGDGLVYAAVAADPFRIDEIEAGGNWDYARLAITENSSDAEAEITELVQRMSSDRGFDYDVLEYRVYRYDNYRVAGGGWWYPRYYGYWDDYYCDPWYRPSLFGCRYYPTGGWYLGYYGNRWGGWGGWGWGGHYDNWWWRRRYWGTPIFHNPNYRYPVVAGRPRGYTIIRRSFAGNDDRSRVGGTFSGAVPGGRGSEPVFRPRPRGTDRSRPEGDAPRSARPSDRDRIDRPSTEEPRSRGTEGASRPRGRRSPITSIDRPNIERDPENGRGPVEFGDQARRGRPITGGTDGVSRDREVERSAPRYDPPARTERPRFERPREAPAERSEPRFDPPARTERPRFERPREAPAVRSEPRSAPPPRVSEPRSSSAPRVSSGGGGGGGGRSVAPRGSGGGGGGGGRPRGRP
jgi:hypothetical protein